MPGKFVIFDCDNVLSDDSWRIPFIRWDIQGNMDLRYRDYHLASAFDVPGNRAIIKHVRAEDVIIFTAMPEEYRRLRHLWFNHNRIGFNKIYMRPTGNHSHSADAKREMLHKFYQDFGVNADNVFCAYDDREDVVEMYRDENVDATLISIHNVSAYKPPVIERIMK